MKTQTTKVDSESGSPTARPRRSPGNVATFRNTRGEVLEHSSVTASEAKSKFGRVLEIATQGGAVVITKHDTPEAGADFRRELQCAGGHSRNEAGHARPRI